MVAVAPTQGVGDEEVGHLIPTEVKDQRAPVLVLALARIFVLIKSRSIEAGQRPIVLGKVSGNPVNENSVAGLMQSVDEVLKIIRGAIAARRRVEARHLISPTGIEGVFSHRHQLDVGEPRAPQVFDQRLSQLPVAKRFADGLLLPGADMQLVDAHRRAQRIRLAAALHPRLIGPGKLAGVPHHSSPLRRQFEGRPHRVGVDLNVTLGVEHFELVQRSFAHPWNENLPDTARSQLSHGMTPAIPPIEIAHHRHPPGTRAPDGEGDATHTV